MRAAYAVLLFSLLIPSISCAQGTDSIQTQATQEPVVSSYSLPADKLAKSKALYETANALMIVETLYGFAILYGVLRWRLGPRFRDWAEAASRIRIVQAFIFVPALLLTLALFDLPFDLYRHRLYLRYGISVQGWGSWFWDWTKGQLVQYVIFSLVLFLLYYIIRRSPARWWFYFWLASVPIVVFVTFLAPVVLEPMFNKFEPLEKTNPALVQAIQMVTKRGGLDIPADRMFEMKASEKVTDYNAYVSGIGATKRVVVWDTTEHDMTTPEIMFVFGHEMGHYVLDHIWKGIAFSFVLLIVGFYVGFRLSERARSRWGEKWGIRDMSDWASLPLLLLVGSVLSFFLTPIGSAFSRHIEHQADIYGLEVIHGLVPESDRTAAAAFQKLGEKSLDYPYPNPLLVFWTYSHPPIPDRLRFSLTYHPWQENRQNKYVK